MVFKKQIFFSMFLLQYCCTFSMHQARCTPYASLHRKEMQSAFYQLIDTARKSLLVSIYTIVDKEVARKLALAKARGVKVSVIMDNSSDRKGYGIKELLEEFDVPTLTYKGSCSINHNKYVIADGKKSWISSMNFTKPAYAKNRESAVLVCSPGIAHFFTKDFQETRKIIQEQERKENLKRKKFEEELNLERKKHQERMRIWRKNHKRT
mgnify:CR=1 FL=1